MVSTGEAPPPFCLGLCPPISRGEAQFPCPQISPTTATIQQPKTQSPGQAAGAGVMGNVREAQSTGSSQRERRAGWRGEAGPAAADHSPARPGAGGGYLLVAAPAGRLVGRELLLHMGGLVYLLGVEGQAAQRAEGGRHLEAGLEALPAEPAGGGDMGLRAAGCFEPPRAAQLPSAVSSTFLKTVIPVPLAR